MPKIKYFSFIGGESLALRFVSRSAMPQKCFNGKFYVRCLTSPTLNVGVVNISDVERQCDFQKPLGPHRTVRLHVAQTARQPVVMRCQTLPEIR